MAKPFKTPSGKWRAQIRRKGQRSISKVFQKKGEASEWLDAMKAHSTTSPFLYVRVTVFVLSVFR